MSKRYREVLDEVETNEEDTTPASFQWRGRRYRVVRVIGHWREDSGWWRRPDGEPVQIVQSDLWRVEAAHLRGQPGGCCSTHLRGQPGGCCSTHLRGQPGGCCSTNGGSSSRGVYELVQRDDEWRLDKVWD